MDINDPFVVYWKVMEAGRGAGEAFLELRGLIAKLRSDEGCPWDKKQTLATLAPHLKGEVDEALAEVESGDPRALAEELGDVFLILLLMIQTAEEEKLFDAAAVLEGACAKVVRRHPHVFAGLKVDSVEEVIANWNRIKEEEKRGAR